MILQSVLVCIERVYFKAEGQYYMLCPKHWAIYILTTKDCDLISISTKWHPFLQPYVSHSISNISKRDVVWSVLMLMLCCSDFTWVQCDRHLVRSWTDNLRRKNLKKKSFSRWVLDKSSFVYNWDFPPWHEAAWWLQWWWPNHGRCHQDHGGKWGWPEEKEKLQHPRSWFRGHDMMQWSTLIMYDQQHFIATIIDLQLW